MEFFLCVIGMVLFIEGFPYAAFPKAMKSAVRMVLEMRPAVLRGFGLLMMLCGILLVFIGKGGTFSGSGDFLDFLK